jgi:thiamine-monophosphate kinase
MSEHPPAQSVAALGEQGLLSRLSGILSRHTGGLPLGTGDDCAITPAATPGNRLVWTLDTMVEGTHFRFWPGTHAGDLGRKLAATNLSDLASKGAAPRFALVSLGLPGDADVALVEAFYAGLDEELTAAGAILLGGDTVRAPQWCLSLTVVGELGEGLPIAARHAARPGDGVFVTGTLGDSAAGLAVLEGGGSGHEFLVDRHLRPTARLAEGRALVASIDRLAMMDLSDGLACDGARLATASGVRVVLDGRLVPLSPALTEWAAAVGRDPRELALHGGEDYELLLCAPLSEPQVRALLAERGIATLITRIGTIEAGEPGLFLRSDGGDDRKLEAKGFEHFT